MNIFTNWYKAEKIEREEENRFCLQKNIDNPLIKKIFLFSDDGKSFPLNDKVVGIVHGRRPTYKDYFDFINSVYPQDINIVCNSDIYFDESIGYVQSINENFCYALTRWDTKKDGIEFYNHADSQDAWIFKGKIKEVNADFELGRLGCDNRIAYELERAKYFIENPSLTIKAIHLHMEERALNGNHDQSTTIPGPYKFVLAKEKEPFLTIITRHCPSKSPQRIEWLEKNMNSIAAQTDNDYAQIVLIDPIGIGSLKANRMFYENRNLIKGQYVFMLDDDDILITDDFVSDMKRLARQYNNPGIIFIKMDIKGTLVPTALCWKKPELRINNIGTSCFIMRRDLWYENIDSFSDIQTGDFEFINTVFNRHPSMIWMDKVYSKTLNVGSFSGI